MWQAPHLPSFSGLPAHKSNLTTSTLEDNTIFSNSYQGNQLIENNLRQYEALQKQNQWLKAEVNRKKQAIMIQKIQEVQQQRWKQCEVQKGEKYCNGQYEDQNDVEMWEIKGRNRYLQEKNEQLRGLQMKQRRKIEEVQQSQEWKNRNKCGPHNCYYRKYLQILRVKSPLL